MIDKLTPRYLETSKDVRLKEAHELIDALNVTVTGDSEGGQGVVKNIKGTDIVFPTVVQLMPEGDNECIGSVRDEGLGAIYFFVYNSLGNHGIYAYSARTNNYRAILIDSSLNFQKNGFVKADVQRIKRRNLPELEASGLPDWFDPCSIPEFINDLGEIDTGLILEFQSLVPEGVDINDIIALQGTVCTIN